MATHNELGEWGEEIAVRFLEQKGYVILDRDWKSGHRDIDIIAQDKTRRNKTFAEPEMAVNYQKIKNLQLAANHYIKYHHINLDVRFDIVSVVGTMGNMPEIDHIEDAF